MLTKNSRREWKEDDRQQQNEVQPQQRAVNRSDEQRHVMVCDPIHADNDEAQYESEYVVSDL